ncbi:hypothetical protein TON_1506 [Thermococcus onnurineus NA1]|uniref:Piwi domain-containing protein n=1 Tax=Thermococcus onnurineus (strain NA1) TaxID=523850 RepID=B6YTQ5_THEON|nr:Piwi domain-containing protein [Thermococcus onnurineus]ACJ16996.1 hypothetical protein TON_1506 [Thermococcus onnurineus NA1]
MEKQTFYQGNMYRLKDELIQDILSDIIVARVTNMPSNPEEAYSEIQKIGGIILNYDEMTNSAWVVGKESLLQNHYPDDMKEVRAFSFSELSKENKTKLVLNILNAEGYLRDIRGHREVVKSINSERSIIRKFLVTVEYDGQHFYLVTLPKYKIIENHTIMELLIEGKITVKELVHNLLKDPKWKIQTSRKDVPLPPGHRVVEIILKTKDPDRYQQELERINEYFTKKTELGPIDDSKYPDDYNIIFRSQTRGKYLSYHSARTKLIRPINKEILREIYRSNEFIKALNIAKKLVADIIYDSTKYPGRAIFPAFKIDERTISYKAVFLKNKTITEKTIQPYYNIKGTFNWLFTNTPFDDISELIIPIQSPEFLRDKTIGVYILYPAKYRENSESLKVIQNLIKSVDSTIKRLSEYFTFLRKVNEGLSLPSAIDIISRIPVNYENLIESAFTRIHSKKGVEYDYHLAITLIPDMRQEQFDKIKGFFFNNGILHKAININNLRDPSKDQKKLIESMILQALYAFGIYFYSLDNLNYDFIIGLDVTREMDKSGRYYGISGAAVVQNKNGQVLKIIPITSPQSSSETANINYLIGNIQQEAAAILNRKGYADILFLRDGKVPGGELEQFKEISRKYNYRFTIIEILKRPLVRFFWENYKEHTVKSPRHNYYFKIGDTYYLTAHYFTNYLKVPLKLGNTYFVARGKISKNVISREDIMTITKLTKLNYSQPENPDKMKLPAPVHLSHRLINYERRELKFNRYEFLKEGALYFL